MESSCGVRMRQCKGTAHSRSSQAHRLLELTHSSLMMPLAAPGICRQSVIGHIACDLDFLVAVFVLCVGHSTLLVVCTDIKFLEVPGHEGLGITTLHWIGSDELMFQDSNTSRSWVCFLQMGRI